MATTTTTTLITLIVITWQQAGISAGNSKHKGLFFWFQIDDYSSDNDGDDKKNKVISMEGQWRCLLKLPSPPPRSFPDSCKTRTINKDLASELLVTACVLSWKLAVVSDVSWDSLTVACVLWILTGYCMCFGESHWSLYVFWGESLVIVCVLGRVTGYC